jgi:glycosyltransferase involved in cell wall biosynthesis
MPLLADEALGRLFCDIQQGRVRLVVWGALPHNDLFLWQCPLPVAYYVDSNPGLSGSMCLGRPVHDPAILKSESPDTLAVCLHSCLGPYLDTLGRTLEAIGPFRYFVPTRIDQPLQGRNVPEPATVLSDLARVVADWTARRDDPAVLAQAILALPLSDHRDHRLERQLAEWRRHPAVLPAFRPGVAVLYLEHLALGGAEGQLCRLGAGLVGRGWAVEVALDRPPPPDSAQYHWILEDHSVDTSVIGQPSVIDWQRRLVETLEPSAALILWHLPPWLLPQILVLIPFLRRVRPEVAIGYLDRPNLILGVAAVLAGVPRILLSGRNLDPTHFPHFYQGQTAEFRTLYQALLSLDGVQFCANAAAGARSYTAWLGLPEGRVPVILNCVDEGTPQQSYVEAGASAGATLRARLKLPAKAPLVVGVFRLEPEKQPTLFVEVLARLRVHRPDVFGVICGTGSLAPAVRTRAAELGLNDALSLPGPIDQIPTLLGEATVLLHVSCFEGTPNILLEAQAAGLPVVCTRIDGSEAILAPDLRPYCRESDDIDGLTAACLAVMTNPSLRRRLGPRLRRFIHQHHSRDRLVNETLALLGLAHCSDWPRAQKESIVTGSSEQERHSYEK